MPSEGASDHPAALQVGACSTMQHPAPLSLLDMPAPWLEQLPTHLGANEVRPLFSCCRFLRDLVLSQRSVLLYFQPPVLPNQQADAQTKLLLACKYPSRVKLAVENRHDVISAASTSHMMTNTMAAAGQPLTAITSVTLGGLDLDALVPSWLMSTCPNMRRVYLWDCQISGVHVPTATTPQCPQLKELELSLSSSQLLSDAPTMLRWQLQLRALPGLNSLSLTGGFSAEPRFLLQCCSVIGPQLTHLRLPLAEAAQLDLHQLVTLFPRVEDLQLPDLMVGDEGMEALLSLQTLRELQCKGFRLQHSYTNRPCAWTHLGFTDLHVASFDRLPLEGGVRFSGAPVARPLGMEITPSWDVAANARVAAVVVRAGIQWGSVVSVDICTRQASTACLVALLPMLSTCRAISIHFWSVRPVTPELLAAMCQFLPSTVFSILFYAGCTFSPEAWPLLVSSLPRAIASVDLIDVDGITEAEVTEMCVHATRPVTVRVFCDTWRWQEGYKLRVQAAMAAAGHQHVLLIMH